jgi:hypothetical protein
VGIAVGVGVAVGEGVRVAKTASVCRAVIGWRPVVRYTNKKHSVSARMIAKYANTHCPKLMRRRGSGSIGGAPGGVPHAGGWPGQYGPPCWPPGYSGAEGG